MDDERMLVVDANAVAGLLHETFGSEMTDVPGTCSHCGNVAVMGTLFAYMHGPGVTLRCSICTGIAIRIARTPVAIHVQDQWTGFTEEQRSLSLQTPWHPVDPTTANSLETQLRRELPTGHSLKHLPTRAVARREDNDDVLFALHADRWAKVHLTWSQTTLPLIDYPTTVFYDSSTDVRARLRRDRNDFDP